MANDFFNELGSSISRATQTAVDKTSSFFGIQKLNVKIATEKGKIEKLYTVLGEAYYKELSAGTLPVGEEISDTVEELAERFARIDSLKADLAAAKGMRICESCGNMANMDDVYCAKCGAKLPDIPVKEEAEEAAEEVAEAVEDAAEAAEEKVEEAAEAVKEAAEEVAEAAESEDD